MARVDVVFIILVIFNISKSLSGVTISVGSRWDSNGNLNGILVVENASMVVFCQINHGSPTLDGIESSIALGNTLFFSGLLPSLTIYNSTWSETFTFTADSWKPYLGFWEMEIQSESFSPRGSVNTGEWYGVVEMDVNTGLLKKTVSIIDPLREPIRNVNLGPVVEWSQAPWTLESPINISFSQSPCSPDVVVMTTLSGASDGVYLGVSFEGLRDNTTSWYDLGALLCSNMPSDDCSVGQLVDFKLTSEYLILLTSEAVYSLKLAPDSFTQELIKKVDVQDVTGDTPLANCRLDYTPACNQEKLLGHLVMETNTYPLPVKLFEGTVTKYDWGYQISVGLSGINEVIFLSKQAQYPGTKPQVLAVSSFPFSAWHPLNLTDTVPLLGLHSPQSGRFLILAQQQHQYSATLYQKENLLSVPPAKIKPLFPPSSIPLDFEPHGACLETVGYHSYLYGNQIWRSYNGVIFLKLVSLHPGDYITVCATSTHHHTTIFLTLMGSIYIAKTAIPGRVVEAESPVSSHTPFVVFIDHLGDVVLGGINVERGVSPQTWTQVIDIEKSIADASHAVETPMTIQHLTARHLMVYPGEINSTGHRESSGSGDSAGEEEPLLSQTAVGQELNAIGMHMLITEIKSLVGGATVAMATSLEPSLLSNMQTPAVSRNVSDLWLQEAPCHHVLTPDPSVARQPTKYMDIADVLYFHVSASYVGVVALPQTGKSLMSVRITNPTLISMQMNRTYDRFGMETVHITVGHRVRNKGVTSIIVSIPSASLRCQSVSFTVTIHCTCPPTKRLHFVYDPPVTAEEFLHSWPKNRKNQSLLTLLEVNYRPPSKLGISIPLTNNVYNADPSKPRLNDHYQASKDSGFLKQCAGKASKEECGCTDEMRLSSLELFTDCRERVYRITYTEKLYPLLKIQERGKEDQVLRAPYLLTVKELNDREDYIVEAAEVIYLADIAKRVGLSAEDIHSPDNLVFKFLATQLYHFRMTVIDGFSYCTLEDEFQIYVDRAPLPGLSQMIIFATVSILMGGVVFVIYLNYLRKTDMPDSHRTRSMIKYYDD